MSNGKLFIGLALGALAGSALACFAHSQKGKKLRKDIHETLQDIRERNCTCNEHHHHHQNLQPEEIIEVVAGKVTPKTENTQSEKNQTP